MEAAVVSDHQQDIWMLGAVDTVVLNDPATHEATFGNKFRTVTELPEVEIAHRWPQ